MSVWEYLLAAGAAGLEVVAVVAVVAVVVVVSGGFFAPE